MNVTNLQISRSGLRKLVQILVGKPSFGKVAAENRNLGLRENGKLERRQVKKVSEKYQFSG
jgi:hypothetical protein